MSRKLGDLTAGIKLYLDETVSGVTTHVPFIYLGVGGNGNGLLLRHYVVAAKRMHSSHVAHYDGCEMDVFLENETTGYLSRFDENTIATFVPHEVSHSDYTLTDDGTVSYPVISRRCFLPTYKMLGYGGGEAGNSYLSALYTYYNTSTANTARIGRTTNETAVVYWMSSASSASQFRFVNTVGTAGNNNASDTSYYYRPALSVSLDTPVSDEGADEIFLLPEGRRTYWFIDAVTPVGKSVDRPAKAKLLVAEHNIQSVAYTVSNNAGDTTPVWTPITNGGVATLTNTMKETENYELAVRVEAQASTHDGYVGEPVLIVETEAGA